MLRQSSLRLSVCSGIACRAQELSCRPLYGLYSTRLCCSNPLSRRHDRSMAFGEYVVQPNGTAPKPVCQKARMTFPSMCNRLARMHCSKAASSQSVAKRCRMVPQIAVNSCQMGYCYGMCNTKQSRLSSPVNPNLGPMLRVSRSILVRRQPS